MVGTSLEISGSAHIFDGSSQASHIPVAHYLPYGNTVNF